MLRNYCSEAFGDWISRSVSITIYFATSVHNIIQIIYYKNPCAIFYHFGCLGLPMNLKLVVLCNVPDFSLLTIEAIRPSL